VSGYRSVGVKSIACPPWFDRLTILSKVEGHSSLSKIMGKFVSRPFLSVTRARRVRREVLCFSPTTTIKWWAFLRKAAVEIPFAGLKINFHTGKRDLNQLR